MEDAMLCVCVWTFNISHHLRLKNPHSGHCMCLFLQIKLGKRWSHSDGPIRNSLFLTVHTQYMHFPLRKWLKQAELIYLLLSSFILEHSIKQSMKIKEDWIYRTSSRVNYHITDIKLHLLWTQNPRKNLTLVYTHIHYLCEQWAVKNHK
jgi:hypothetical protein